MMCCGAERPLRGVKVRVILPGRTHRRDWTRHLGPKTLGWSAHPYLSERETHDSVSKSRLLTQCDVHSVYLHALCLSHTKTILVIKYTSSCSVVVIEFKHLSCTLNIDNPTLDRKVCFPQVS